MLHPDGKNHLSDERRTKKLSDSDYFKQRLFNQDSRFRDNTHWVFASALYREKKEFARNVDLAFKKGKKNVSKEGKTVYRLDDWLGWITLGHLMCFLHFHAPIIGGQRICLQFFVNTVLDFDVKLTMIKTRTMKS